MREIKMRLLNKKTWISGLLFTLLLAGCASKTLVTTEAPKAGFGNITDIPIPSLARMDMRKSMVSGDHDQWIGHLVYDTKRSEEETIDYLLSEMPEFGWTKVSELRGKETSLIFSKQGRVATIIIHPKNTAMHKGAHVDIDMSNKTYSASEYMQR